MKTITNRQLRRANRFLLIAILLINGYIVSAPILPRATYWWQSKHSPRVQQLQTAIEQPPKPAEKHPNSIIIPKMMLDTPIIEGPESDSFNLLNQGAWRLPFASSPDKGSNTVIVGHRFSYTGPRGIFYYMDKLSQGDDIALWWDNEMYKYKVESTHVARSTDVEVQEPTDDDRLTLYTCTPLWNPVKRLVVVAKPVEKPLPKNPEGPTGGSSGGGLIPVSGTPLINTEARP